MYIAVREDEINKDLKRHIVELEKLGEKYSKLVVLFSFIIYLIKKKNNNKNASLRGWKPWLIFC